MHRRGQIFKKHKFTDVLKNKHLSKLKKNYQILSTSLKTGSFR